MKHLYKLFTENPVHTYKIRLEKKFFKFENHEEIFSGNTILKIINFVNTIHYKYKNYKIMLSKSMLAEFLENNPIHSTAHNGIKGVYSVTNEKQTLMEKNICLWRINTYRTSNPNK